MGVVSLGAARVEHGGDAVAPAGVEEHAVDWLVAASAAGEVEIEGVAEAEVVADDPALAGAEDDDVVAGGHGGDGAAPPGGVALEGVDGEEVAGGPAGVHGGGDRTDGSVEKP